MAARRLIIPAAGFLAVGLFAVLYAFDRAAYAGLLKMLMQRPFPHPFIDWEWLPSAVACWAKGVDVYVNNTCYTALPGGRFNYSPLWLRATFLPAGQAWVAPFGVGIALAFFASLGVLPLPQGRRAWVVTGVATFSSLTAQGVERGNADLVLFVMVVAGVRLWSGRMLPRLLAYVLFGLASLLKFYPLVVFLLALRERVRVLACVCLGLAATLAVFLWAYGGELQRALAQLPRGKYFADMFGAVNLPFGLAQAGMFMLSPDGARSESFVAAGRAAGFLLLAALILESALRAGWLVRSGGVRGGLAAMSEAERGFLVAGAALVVGCFLAGQSIGYRGVFLLLALPGLLRLAHALPGRPARRVMGLACGAIVFVMWVLTIQVVLFLLGLDSDLVASGSVVGMAHWLMHELAWWCIVGVLMSVLFAFALDSTFIVWLRARAGRPREI